MTVLTISDSCCSKIQNEVLRMRNLLRKGMLNILVLPEGLGLPERAHTFWLLRKANEDVLEYAEKI